MHPKADGTIATNRSRYRCLKCGEVHLKFGKRFSTPKLCCNPLCHNYLGNTFYSSMAKYGKDWEWAYLNKHDAIRWERMRNRFYTIRDNNLKKGKAAIYVKRNNRFMVDGYDDEENEEPSLLIRSKDPYRMDNKYIEPALPALSHPDLYTDRAYTAVENNKSDRDKVLTSIFRFNSNTNSPVRRVSPVATPNFNPIRSDSPLIRGPVVEKSDPNSRILDKLRYKPAGKKKGNDQDDDLEFIFGGRRSV